MKTTRKMFAALTSTLLACSMLSAIPASAEELYFSPIGTGYAWHADLLDQPDMVAAERGSMDARMLLTGIAVRFDGTPENGMQLGGGSYTVYTEYSDYLAARQSGRADIALLRDYETVLEDHQGIYGQVDQISYLQPEEAEGVLEPDWIYTGETDNLYVLTCDSAGPTAWATRLEQAYIQLEWDDRFEIVGSMYLVYRGYYYFEYVQVEFVSDEAGLAMKDELSTYGQVWYYGEIWYPYTDNYTSAEVHGMTLAEAIALCETLKQDTAHVANAYPECVSDDLAVDPSSAVILKPVAEPAAAFGDVDGNGTVQIVDAQAALKAAAAIMVENTPEISPEQLEIANVDGIGTVTVKDAQYILIYAANTIAEIPTSWQELTGNPNAPAAGN